MNEQLQTIIDALGLTYTATFVPTKQPADKVKNPQLHWEITLSKGPQTMTLPYHEGCAHVMGYQQYHKTPYEKRLHDEMIREACETGVTNTDWAKERYYFKHKVKQPEPKLADVLYCLVTDANVLNSGGFEAWASNYGYDTDSRKAEQTYRQCIDQSLQFKNLIGQSALEQLQEAFQDY